MQSFILAWVTAFILLTGAAPWAWALLGRSSAQPRPALTFALAPLLGTGTYTWTALLLGIAGLPVDLRLSMPICISLWAIGAAWAWPRSTTHTSTECCTGAMFGRLAALACLVVSGAVVLNATLWPFYRDDAVALYEPFARQLASTRALVPLTSESLYALYPQHMPLAYATMFQAAGWPNPYPARLSAAILSLTCLPATFALAWNTTARRPLAAWSAAVMLAVMPAFAHWASSGYVDLPTAALTALAALFTYAAWRDRRATDAWLAGLCVGLAAWTKNAALISCVVYACIMIYAGVRRRLSLKSALGGIALAVAISAPWYLRNLIGTGTLNPATVWVDQAEPTWRTALAFLARPQDYTVSGWVIFLSTLYALFRALRGHTPSVLLLAFALPTYTLWLMYASYDPRFLLLILPILAALGGVFVADAWQAIPPAAIRLRQLLAWCALCLMILLTALSAEHAIEHKRALLANPLMTHQERREVVLPDEPHEGRPAPP